MTLDPALLARLGPLHFAGEATDPRLKDALNASAANLEKLAGDTDNLSKLNSLDQVGQTTQKFATALSDIADYCA